VSVLIRFSPPSLTAKQYDEVVRRLNEEGVFPAEGLDYEHGGDSRSSSRRSPYGRLHL